MSSIDTEAKNRDGAALVQAPPELIINADDWGRDRLTTDRILDCALRGSISSTSAMVFMEDSERGAELAMQQGVDTGVHLNMTTDFSAPGCSSVLKEHQQRLGRFLLSHMRARMVYRPDLAKSFDYVVRAQFDEYERIYGIPPHHVDGHHHMHLCENILLQGLIPRELFVRRGFTFFADEKGPVVRAFRQMQYRRLVKRFQVSDHFFDILPLAQSHFDRIFPLCATSNVECECHPALDPEYKFLMEGGLERALNGITVARGYKLRSFDGLPRKVFTGTAGVGSDAAAQATPIEVASSPVPHICVCLCTYKRPDRLRRLLADIGRQRTGGLFTFSLLIVDNDAARSSEAAVMEAAAAANLSARYLVEPRQGIARARNLTFTSAEGDYLALIDDDEIPKVDWLLRLYTTICEYGVDGVLGPVLRHFDHRPPAWLEKSNLLVRRVNPSGSRVLRGASRTGNVLLKRSIVAGEATPFREELRAGEDQDFFDRKLREGYRFVWSSDAVVFEVNSAARSKWQYFVRRTLLQGACDIYLPGFGPRMIVRSAAAVVVFTAKLPFSLLRGGHGFMENVKKLAYHVGRLLMAAGIDPVREVYATDVRQRNADGSQQKASGGL